MSRLFNVEVFDESVAGGGAEDTFGNSYYVNQQFWALLGSPDVLRVQVIIDSVVAADTTFKIFVQTTNALREETWKAVPNKGSETLIDNLTDPPKVDWFSLSIPTDGVGAYVRFQVVADRSGGRVRIIAAGWGH